MSNSRDSKDKKQIPGQTTQPVVQPKKLTIEEHKYVLDQVNMWINNADSKVTVFCALFTIVFGIIAFAAEQIITKRIANAKEINLSLMNLAMVLIYIGVGTFFLSMWFCFRSITPKLTGMAKKKDIKSGLKPKYSIFYGSISQIKDDTEYLKLAELATEIDFKNEMIKEIFINSCICTKKMQNYKIGIWISYVSLLVEAGSCIALFYAPKI